MRHYKIYQHAGNSSTREQREKGAETIFEKLMVKNFPNFLKNINLHIQEIQQTTSSINSKRSINRHL